MALWLPLGTYGLMGSAGMPEGIFAGWVLDKSKACALCRDCCSPQEGGITNSN